MCMLMYIGYGFAFPELIYNHHSSKVLDPFIAVEIIWSEPMLNKIIYASKQDGRRSGLSPFH